MTKAEQLELVRQSILQDVRCPLRDTAKNLVFGKGNPDAPIMFIGEAPGEQEDLQGLPFVGAAGKELDKLLHLIGLSLDQAYIANILKYRPPGNRAPRMDEIKHHTPYLVEQIKIIQPRVLATLGNFATKFVLAHFDADKMKTIDGMTKLHGQHIPLTINGLSCTVVPLYHPAAILYRPQWRTDLERDFLSMKNILFETYKL